MLDGELVKQLRIGAGMTQQKFAVKAGCSITQVSEIENGHNTNPRAKTIKAVAGALGVKPSVILNWEG